MRPVTLCVTDLVTYCYCQRAFALFPLSGRPRAFCLPYQKQGSKAVHRFLAQVFIALAKALYLGKIPESWRSFSFVQGASVDDVFVEEQVEVPVAPGIALVGVPDLWWRNGSDVVVVDWKVQPWEFSDAQQEFYAALLGQGVECDRVVVVEVDIEQGPGRLRVYTREGLIKLWDKVSSLTLEISAKISQLWRGWDIDNLFPCREGCSCQYGFSVGARMLKIELPKQSNSTKEKQQAVSPEKWEDELGGAELPVTELSEEDLKELEQLGI